VKEVLGNGGCVDFNSMEKTFSHTLVAEGQKQGYMNATCVLDQLKVHGQIDKETASLIEMPDVATILEE
jgi:hypothetical protein